MDDDDFRLNAFQQAGKQNTSEAQQAVPNFQVLILIIILLCISVEWNFFSAELKRSFHQAVPNFRVLIVIIILLCISVELNFFSAELKRSTSSFLEIPGAYCYHYSVAHFC